MCTNPIKIRVNQNIAGETTETEIYVPCGKCDTCRRRRAKDWAIKLIKEAKYHKECCFITLTFSNEILLNKESKAVKKYGAQPNFPWNIKASKEYFKKFIKRLRKKFLNKKITFYHIGEYGEKTHRAHHHVLLFGCDFREDYKKAELSKSGKEQFYSQTLEDLWACGRTRIQLVNNNNIAYIAGYSQKKYKNKNDKFKEVQSFSNRSRMSAKWIRRFPEHLPNMILKDNENKIYNIPKSYIREMKKECELKENPLFIQSYEKYEENINDFICNINTQEYRNEQLKKEYIRRKRNFYKIRDFD